MSVSFARPNVTQLVFQLFGRELHPELIDVVVEGRIERSAFEAKLQICDAGHVINFRHAGQTLCEVATTREHPLPRCGRILSHGLRGHRCESLQFGSGVMYHVSIQLEVLEPEVFRQAHEELLADSYKADFSYRFATPSRLGPMPLSFLHAADSPDSLLVEAFHTYPDNHAVVKTQTLFELDG